MMDVISLSLAWCMLCSFVFIAVNRSIVNHDGVWYVSVGRYESYEIQITLFVEQAICQLFSLKCIYKHHFVNGTYWKGFMWDVRLTAVISTFQLAEIVLWWFCLFTTSYMKNTSFCQFGSQGRPRCRDWLISDILRPIITQGKSPVTRTVWWRLMVIISVSVVAYIGVTRG